MGDSEGKGWRLADGAEGGGKGGGMEVPSAEILPHIKRGPTLQIK
jgi:hypothetical protein